jgi:hypothetical protein
VVSHLAGISDGPQSRTMGRDGYRVPACSIPYSVPTSAR